MAKGKYQKWLELDSLILLEGWARDGLTDEQIAHNMGVAYSTLRDWKNKYPALSAALKKGKEVVDNEVENALLKRALGYSYKEIKTKDDGDKIEVTETIKEVVPDVTAQIYWLKNRRPDKWRDKQKEETNTAALDKLDDILREIKEDAENAVHD